MNQNYLFWIEPFTGLDPLNVAMFMDVIQELSKKKTAIIFSSHRMEHVELFCEKLVVLVKGKSVLEGSLKQIKKDYRKKNIFINGDCKLADFKNIKGVVDATKTGDGFIVKIEDESYIQNVFEYIKKCKNVTKFNVEEASLNEIFVSKVGESYEA